MAAPERVTERMDETFLALAAAAALVLLLPWERLTSVKAAGIEVGLGSPQVESAIQSLGLDRLEIEQLRSELERLEPALRSSGTAGSSGWTTAPTGCSTFGASSARSASRSSSCSRRNAADTLLRSDGDFDVFTTNVERREEEERVTYAWLRERLGVAREDADAFWAPDGRQIRASHEGTNYVLRLRLDETLPDPVRALPVLFYSGFDWTRLIEYTRAAVAASPATEVARTPQTFLPKAIRLLAAARAERDRR